MGGPGGGGMGCGWVSQKVNKLKVMRQKIPWKKLRETVALSLKLPK
jgi:hypothetical protein